MKRSFSLAVAIAFLVMPLLAQAGTKKKVIHSDVTVTKKNDKASAQLSQRTTTSSPHPTATPVKKPVKKAVVSTGVLNDKAISKPPPSYPPIVK